MNTPPSTKRETRLTDESGRRLIHHLRAAETSYRFVVVVGVLAVLVIGIALVAVWLI